MYIINFIVCLLLPYLAKYGFFGPTQDLVPYYFAQNDLVWIAATFGSVIGFWLGLLRNFVSYNSVISEIGYQRLLWLIVVTFIITKIIFAIPHMILTLILSFFLGMLAIPKGQSISKFAVRIMAMISIVTVAYFGFILTMVAWFKQSAAIYYYYIIVFKNFIANMIISIKTMLFALLLFFQSLTVQ